MRRSHLVVIVAGFILILGAQVVYTLLLSTPSGIRIKSPERNAALPATFVVSGDAWMKTGVWSVVVEAAPGGSQDVGPMAFPASRDTVRDGDRILFPLSSWSTRLTLPSSGPWEVRAVATGADGSTLRSAARRLSVQAGVPVREFRSWTPEHVVPMAVILGGALALGVFVRRASRGSPAIETSPRFRRTALVLTVVVWVNEIAYQVYWFLAGGWSVTGALMLQMCGLAILLLLVMLLLEDPRRRQRWFDVLYFWGVGGALQALIAPDIGANGFPAYRYFSFFLSHGLIIVMTVLMAMAGGVTITWRSLLRAFVVTNILLIPIYAVDQLIRRIPPYDPGNYFVLGYPPPTGSVVDVFARVFGPSPRYLIGLELMGLAVFLMLLVPWPIARALSARRRVTGSASRRAPGAGISRSR